MDIYSEIDNVFECSEGKTEELREFVEVLRQNQSEAEKSFRRALILFFLAWGVVFFIGAGLVTEATLVSVKISIVKDILIVGPIVLGFISYSIASSAAMVGHLFCALSQSYKHILPEVYTQDLEYLLPPPTVITVERHYAYSSKNKFGKFLSEKFVSSLGLLIVLLTASGILHA